MKISLKEITDQPTDLVFDQTLPWVQQTLAESDEHHTLTAQERPTQFHCNLVKVDELVVCNGHLDTALSLSCSRCAKEIHFDIHSKFKSLFCQDPEMAGVGYLSSDPQKSYKANHLHHDYDSNNEMKPVNKKGGYARHAHDETPLDESIDITYIEGDKIDLSLLLNEQAQVMIPFQPLCKEDCKGLCPNCGSDLNLGRCACAKITKDTPFSGLKDLKLTK